MSVLGVRASAQALAERVLHLWVDPRYGNDSMAASTNPALINPNVCVPGQDVPADVRGRDTLGNPNMGMPLLHAPFPFKTITQAVAYINKVTPLPYVSPIANVKWSYAIIHLLPGRYAANLVTTIDPHTQQPGNGETFPILLPNRVSVQGTSALNTVIDLEGLGPAFHFGSTSGTTGDGSFVSHLSIFGAFTGLTQPNRAAIWIDPNNQCKPTIHNCILFANGAGVVVASRHIAPPPPHEVLLVNNTFAWNGVGVWNGYITAPPFQNFGRDRLMLVNNLFDSTPPAQLGLLACGAGARPFPSTWASFVGMGTNVGGLCFEGIDAGDVLVNVGAGVSRDFNAYETGRFNTISAVGIALLPATRPDPMAPQITAPGVEISPFTGAGTNSQRGVLFVRDLFHNGIGIGNPASPFVTSTTCRFDLSPGDFRLAPAAAPAHPTTSAPIPPGNCGVLNPLVDAGYCAPTITMTNGLSIARHPLARVLETLEDQATWPFDGWEDFTDCEGYGNPRVKDHPLYGGPQEPPFTIDIGADELDLLVVAGQRFGTTIFSDWTNVSFENRYIWLLGVPNTLSAPAAPNAARPRYSGNWWASRGPSDRPQFAGPWDFNGMTTYYNPIVVDVTPHLLPDLHPYHAGTTSATWPSNPVWQDCPVQQPALSAIHNAWLYVDPIAPIVNPHGSLASPVLLPGFNWLDGITPSPFAQHTPNQSGGSGAQPVWWGLGSVIAGAPLVLTYGNWCQNVDAVASLEADVLGVPYAGMTTWESIWPYHPTMPGKFSVGDAMRVTLEFEQREWPVDSIAPGGPFHGVPYGDPAGSNLQSFLIVRKEE